MGAGLVVGVTAQQFAYPLTMDGAGFATVDQDSLDDVADCVEVLVSTQRGSRLELPTYGVDDPVGTRNLDDADVLAQIAEWEPRAVVDADDVTLVDGVADLVLDVGLTQ